MSKALESPQIHKNHNHIPIPAITFLTDRKKKACEQTSFFLHENNLGLMTVVPISCKRKLHVIMKTHWLWFYIFLQLCFLLIFRKLLLKHIRKSSTNKLLKGRNNKLGWRKLYNEENIQFLICRESKQLEQHDVNLVKRKWHYTCMSVRNSLYY